MKSSQHQNPGTGGSMEPERPAEQTLAVLPAKAEAPGDTDSPRGSAEPASVETYQVDISPWLRYNSCPICGRMTSGLCNNRGVTKMTCPGCGIKIRRRDKGRRVYELMYTFGGNVFCLEVHALANREN